MEKRAEMILTAGPSITEKEISYVSDAAANGWNSDWDGYIKRFESAFAEYVGTRHAVTTSSCTGALHLGLSAMGVGPGDEVIVPDITWVASASSVSYTGARPVFADIDAETWCISPESLAARITPRTKAVMPVHLYGHPADMDGINRVAREHDLDVIEDAAPSLGAEYGGRRTGSLGRASAFSFQGAKIATAGEGGMFATDDDCLHERVVKLGDHGRSPERALWNDEIGFKYKMSNLQAAMGLAQLERIEELVEKKRRIFSWYRDGLGGARLSMNAERDGCRSIYWMTTVVLEGQKKRDEVIAGLRGYNVDSRPVFYRLSSMPMFESTCNPAAESLSRNGINLPSGHNLTKEDVEYVCSALLSVLGEA